MKITRYGSLLDDSTTAAAVTTGAADELATELCVEWWCDGCGVLDVAGATALDDATTTLLDGTTATVLVVAAAVVATAEDVGKTVTTDAVEAAWEATEVMLGLPEVSVSPEQRTMTVSELEPHSAVAKLSLGTL